MVFLPLQDAQKAMIFTPEFNTMGNPMAGGVRPPSPPPSQTGSGSGYKAVVMLFLKGGMDSFQMSLGMDGWQNELSLRFSSLVT